MSNMSALMLNPIRRSSQVSLKSLANVLEAPCMPDASAQTPFPLGTFFLGGGGLFPKMSQL
jgi:hypothetical protein